MQPRNLGARGSSVAKAMADRQRALQRGFSSTANRQPVPLYQRTVEHYL